MTCYLIRHGQDDRAVRGGWSSSGLTDEGKSQVENLVNHIVENRNKPKIERLFSSATILAGMPSDVADKKHP